MNDIAAGSPAAVAIDPENPWLGLFSYSEETRAFFHGRDEETAELARRVQRKLLTVLFGQSGLGKTSLLRAGLVPRLREEGYCPVYVRIDYAATSPPPAEQIKQAILKDSAAAGAWSRPGSAVEGESLWEFMHHRGDLLRDADGNTLLPLLIFDQFEEIFTLAQADDRGRKRAHEFLEQLADLVENRPPAALEARLDSDEDAAADFDFARADYRVLIALREDYLAHLESVKASMPSITQNRMRLARMNGTQALAAVLQPGGRLVSQEVAEAIVRFVAGGSELANAEIEPSLLSLVCRELNTVRQLQGRSEISADLLAGSRDSILSEFYERTMADQPAAVRRVIEDELLTESGYRESLAEERVSRALAAAGAAHDTLAKLVDRRLLRIEERLDMRRVELTHDVLCGVVLSSRDKRHEREQREQAERQLADQQAREEAQHRALVRARAVAGVCAVLMLVAVASAVFGWVNLQRAREADVATQKARGDAEKLVGFLIEDFYDELAPTGRLDTLGKLAHMTVGYYDGLPPELVTPKTETYRAMALIREAEAQKGSGDFEGARKNFAAAIDTLKRLHDGGDHSDPVVIGLALAYYGEGSGGLGSASGSDGEILQKAADLLRPLVQQEGQREAKLLYANALNYLSHTDEVQAIATTQEARAILTAMGALDVSDLDAAAVYADVADSEARHLLDFGRVDEAVEREKETYDLAEKVLAQRPNDLRSIGNRYYAAQLLGDIAERQYDYDAALSYAERAAQAGEDLVRYNPADLTSWNFWVSGLAQASDVELESGQVREALASMQATLALAKDPRRPSNLAPVLWNRWQGLSLLQTRMGDKAGAERSLRSFAEDVVAARDVLPERDVRRQVIMTAEPQLRSRIRLLQGDPRTALDDATTVVERLDRINLEGDNRGTNVMRDNVMRGALRTATRAALLLGQAERAEKLARRWLVVPDSQNNYLDPRDESSRANAAIAHALAMQSQDEEARTLMAPVLAYYAEQEAIGATGLSFHFDHAYALYVSALAEADPAKRAAALARATRLIEEVPVEARDFSDIRMLAGLIATARATPRA